MLQRLSWHCAKNPFEITTLENLKASGHITFSYKCGVWQTQPYRIWGLFHLDSHWYIEKDILTILKIQQLSQITYFIQNACRRNVSWYNIAKLWLLHEPHKFEILSLYALIHQESVRYRHKSQTLGTFRGIRKQHIYIYVKIMSLK
jgi:hypothetical protein